MASVLGPSLSLLPPDTETTPATIPITSALFCCSHIDYLTYVNLLLGQHSTQVSDSEANLAASWGSMGCKDPWDLWRKWCSFDQAVHL